MTLKEAKNVIYANVIYACETAGLSPSTIAIVKDACDTVIALAEQADTPQTEETEAERLDRIDNEIEDAWARIKELTPHTDCQW